MSEDLTRTDGIEEGQVAARDAADEGQAQDAATDAVTVVQPPVGEEAILPVVAGETYDLRFDPRRVEVRVIDDEALNALVAISIGAQPPPP